MQFHKVDQLRGLLKQAAPQGVDVVFDPGGFECAARAAQPHAAGPQGRPGCLCDRLTDGRCPRFACATAVGGDFFTEALKAVRWGAHMCIIGFASGAGVWGGIQQNAMCALATSLCSTTTRALQATSPSALACALAAIGQPARAAAAAVAGLHSWLLSHASHRCHAWPLFCSHRMPLNIALIKNCTLHGIYWGSYQIHNPRVFRQRCGGGRRMLCRARACTHSCSAPRLLPAALSHHCTTLTHAHLGWAAWKKS